MEELQDTRDLPAHENREGEARPQPQVGELAIAREVGVARDVRYPGRGPAREDASRQPDAPGESEGLAGLAKRLEFPGAVEVPQTGGTKLLPLIGLQEGMADRPSGERADRVDRRLQRFFEGG